ncbi:DUF4174 domain-containing protein [Algoriphagus taiwanensis]|uniref:DUF4174 domain-containing protein n=1 Tax=Algoriphagus taiwanensis TaxID=1445656 RepID=A0ABQ6Q4U2_9BACT|nr:hypothetical protein Ataiwa_28580 [Algoriphagus taiwanensis]
MNWIGLLAFSLLTLLGKSLTPQDFVWEYRLLIITEVDFLGQDWSLDGKKTDLEDRRLLVFVLSDGKLIQSNCKESIDIPSFLRFAQATQARDESPNWVLVGLDGGKKSWGRGVPNLEDIFRKIDAMPMRQSEIRKRGNG